MGDKMDCHKLVINLSCSERVTVLASPPVLNYHSGRATRKKLAPAAVGAERNGNGEYEYVEKGKDSKSSEKEAEKAQGTIGEAEIRRARPLETKGASKEEEQKEETCAGSG